MKHLIESLDEAVMSRYKHGAENHSGGTPDPKSDKGGDPHGDYMGPAPAGATASKGGTVPHETGVEGRDMSFELVVDDIFDKAFGLAMHAMGEDKSAAAEKLLAFAQKMVQESSDEKDDEDDEEEMDDKDDEEDDDEEDDEEDDDDDDEDEKDESIQEGSGS
jgi:hypothetical protein